MILKSRNGSLLTLGLVFWIATCLVKSQAPVPMTQPPAAFANIYAAAGVYVSDEEVGWAVDARENSTGVGSAFSKGGFEVSVYADGSFQSVTNNSRHDSALSMAKTGDLTVQIANEEQAYQRAQTVLTNVGLWSAELGRWRCKVGPSEFSGANEQWLGLACAEFRRKRNGIEIVTAPVYVTMNIYNGEILTIYKDPPLTVNIAAPTVTEQQARAAALAFAQALPPSGEDYQAAITAIATSEFTLGYNEASTPSAPFATVLNWETLASRTGFYVDAATGGVTIAGSAHHDLTQDQAGSSMEGTSASKAPFVAGVAGICALVAVVILFLRRR